MQAKDAKVVTEEIRLKVQHDLDYQGQRSKHQTDLNDLEEEEKTIVDQEIPTLKDDIFILQNEFTLTEQRLQNIRQEKTLLKQSNKEYTEILTQLGGFQGVLHEKGNEENQDMENLQVKNYQETILKAQLQEDMDAYLIYLEEFIKRTKGDLLAEDYFALKELNFEDQQTIQDVLEKFGFNYEKQ